MPHPSPPSRSASGSAASWPLVSAVCAGLSFAGFELYELALWLIVKGRVTDAAFYRDLVFLWMLCVAVMAAGVVVLGLQGGGAAAMGTLKAFGRRYGVGRPALFAVLVVQSHVLFVRPAGAQSTAMILFRTAQGLTALWFALTLTALAYRWCVGRGWLERLAGNDVNGRREWSWLLPPVVFILGLAFIHGVWGAIPHIIDETAYLFQAWVIGLGRTWLPVPPMGEFFEVEFIGRLGGKWFGYYPPGWSVALAPFVHWGVPWLVNPLLGAAAMLLLLQVLRIEGLERWSWAAVPLLVMSPEVLMESGTYMNENLVLVANLAAVAALTGQGGARERGRVFRLIVAGAAAGAAFSTRYLDGLCLLGLGLVLIAQNAGRSRLREAGGAAAVLMLVFAVFVGANLLYNRSITGRWLQTPFKYYTDAVYGPDYTRLGFGPGVGKHLEVSWAPGHSPGEALYNIQLNLQTLNRTLWGWLSGSLLPALAFLVFGRKTRRDWTWLAFIAAWLAAYALWWYHGVGLGARYYYPLLFIWVIWTLKGFRWAVEEAGPLLRGGGAQRLDGFAFEPGRPGRIGSGRNDSPRPGIGAGCAAHTDSRRGRVAVALFILVNQVLALLGFWPVLTGAFLFDFLGVTREVQAALAVKGVGEAVVFIDDEGRPPIYQYYFLLNRPRPAPPSSNPPPAAGARPPEAPPGPAVAGPIEFDSPVIFLRHRGEEADRKWRAWFADRPFFVYRRGVLTRLGED
ncbi:MAG: hypothetical protein Kow0059_20900 [Candidatus Sumerlaeia bacterium]